MATYKYGKYSQQGFWDIEPVKFYAVYKKTLFGWKEFNWWRNNTEGQRRMTETVETLRQAGNIVYPD